MTLQKLLGTASGVLFLIAVILGFISVGANSEVAEVVSKLAMGGAFLTFMFLALAFPRG